MIKCAHCQGKHDTVQQVKDCSRNNFEETTEQRCRRDGGAPSLTTSYDRETLRRKNEAINRLAPRRPGMIKTGPNGIMAQLRNYTQRDLDEGQRAMDEQVRQAELREDEMIAAYKASRPEKMDFSPAPRNLDEQRARQGYTGGNKQSPREVRPSTTGFPKVPEGHYAIERDGQVKFYKVNHGKSGSRWDGYVFLDVQASDVYYPIKNREHKQEILAAIAEDVEGAMTRYGREIGRCGAPRCGRTLTDPESIARGIGPVCAEKMGW
jgi:Family of unknown function (DUF6011)